MSAGTDGLRLTVAWFETGMPSGPALGDPETLVWVEFVTISEHHRDCFEEKPSTPATRAKAKDGPCIVPARFKLEDDGRQVRRKAVNVIARTAIFLDIEANKITGEVPPSLDEAMQRARALGLAALGYNSYSHTQDRPRYRVGLPLDREIAPDLPAVEVMAERLGLLGVIDMSKRNPASVFYLPARPYDAPDDLHRTIVVPGAAIDAAWLETAAGRLLADRQAEEDRLAAAAQADAAARREAKLAAGFDPDDSLIEKLRSRFDLDSVLRSHGYDKAGTKYRHPNSSSGSFGADIKTLGGIERVFSHNGTDPLHADNLPAWCDVTAVDAIDAVVILDFGGDRTRALRELAQRFNLTKKAERKELTAMLHRLAERLAPPEEVAALAFADGARLGLSRDKVIDVVNYVARCRRDAA